ncbi:MAG: hypothetical protein IKJ16_00350 [Agathobacter sp.]|nr:hypothetical protein [Agathobacter sp.]
MNKKSFLDEISTRPNRSSIVWGDKNFSLLSSILLYTIWIARVLSLLQICKFVYRILVQKVREFKNREQLDTVKKVEEGKILIDNTSGRVNVPPIFCEIYFLIWLLYLIAVHHFPSVFSGTLVQISVVYYLFESVVWVLYYTIFRRFFEEGYSIYHELEYLTNLLLVIPTQALCFAFLYQMSFRKMIAGLLGAGSDATPFPVSILGALFGAIVISMIISTFPLEAVRKHATKYHMIILGNGDVVKNRLIPAIQNSIDSDKCTYDTLPKTDTEFDQLDPVQIGEKCKDFCARIKSNTSKNAIAWIETPTPSHKYYIEQLLALPLPLIVVEKPIANTVEDLETIEKLIQKPGNRPRLFFLSYYLLEKALPLYYLTTGNSLYEKYLDIDDKPTLYNWRQRLGHLSSISVDICEGEDFRAWAFDNANGGQLIETFIHNVLIATLFCGLPNSWDANPVWNYQAQPAGSSNPTTIELSAQKKKTSIHLLMMKNAPAEAQKRTVHINFANGSIVADLATQSATITFDDINSECEIKVNELYNKKYHIQLDLVKRVHCKECRSEEVDGLANQIEVLKWLIDGNNI